MATPRICGRGCLPRDRNAKKSMNSFTRIPGFLLSLGFFALLFVGASAQSSDPGKSGPEPYLQDIKLPSDPNPGNLVTKTSSVSPVAAARANSSMPALADVDIPGYTGILVQKLDGTTVVEYGSNIPLNPASN